MTRYTQYEWEMMCFSHRAEPDRYMAGDDPRGWTVDGVHGQVLNPDDGTMIRVRQIKTYEDWLRSLCDEDLLEAYSRVQQASVKS